MKIKKVEILAALALAFALGLAVPGRSFALTAEDDTVAQSEEANSEGDGEGDNQVVSSVSQSIADLYNRIMNDEDSEYKFDGYRKAADKLIPAMQLLAGYTGEAKPLLEQAEIWDELDEETQEAIEDGEMNLYDALDYIKDEAGEDYTTFQTEIDKLLGEADGAMTTIKAEVKSLTSSDLDLDSVEDPAELIEKVEASEGGFPNYAAYVMLYNAMKLVSGAVPVSGVLTAENVEAKLTDAEQTLAYNKIATAALAIDGSVLTGLSDAWKYPVTSAPEEPSTPNSGIVGLIESGAMDLGMVTLIASVAVASIAGAALIAKLYLKHKF